MRKMIFQPLEDSTLVRFYTDSRTLKFAPKKVTFTACTESVGRSVSVEWEKKVISAIGEIPPQIWQCFHSRERFSAHHKRFPIYEGPIRRAFLYWRGISFGCIWKKFLSTCIVTPAERFVDGVIIPTLPIEQQHRPLRCVWLHFVAGRCNSAQRHRRYGGPGLVRFWVSWDWMRSELTPHFTELEWMERFLGHTVSVLT